MRQPVLLVPVPPESRQALVRADQPRDGDRNGREQCDQCVVETLVAVEDPAQQTGHRRSSFALVAGNHPFSPWPVGPASFCRVIVIRAT